MEKRHEQGDKKDAEQQRTPSNPHTEGEGQNFAPPQKDDWPDEDESIQHPGGPTK